SGKNASPSQGAQPSGKICEPISVSMNTVLANGRQGRPRYTLSTPSAATSSQRRKTKPYTCAFVVEAAVIYELRKLLMVHDSNTAVASPKIKSVVPSIKQSLK